MFPFSLVNLGLAFELLHTPRLNSLQVVSVMISLLMVSWICSYTNILVTVIRFLVSVPVLSEQILSAPPIVSQA
jgi:hypothetical protein